MDMDVVVSLHVHSVPALACERTVPHSRLTYLSTQDGGERCAACPCQGGRAFPWRYQPCGSRCCRAELPPRSPRCTPSESGAVLLALTVLPFEEPPWGCRLGDGWENFAQPGFKRWHRSRDGPCEMGLQQRQPNEGGSRDGTVLWASESVIQSGWKRFHRSVGHVNLLGMEGSTALWAS